MRHNPSPIHAINANNSMTSKPTLSESTTPEQFSSASWLKTELVNFCSKHQLPTSGSKEVLSDRIRGFLQTSNTPTPPTKPVEASEYSQFIRDYFASETKKTLGKAIKAWKLVTSVEGPNTYAFFKKLVSQVV